MEARKLICGGTVHLPAPATITDGSQQSHLQSPGHTCSTGDRCSQITLNRTADCPTTCTTESEHACGIHATSAVTIAYDKELLEGSKAEHTAAETMTQGALCVVLAVRLHASGRATIKCVRREDSTAACKPHGEATRCGKQNQRATVLMRTS